MSQIIEKNFTVVHFQDDNSVEVVPSKWISNLDDKILCYWPNRKPDNFKHLLEDHTSCPPDNWNKWIVSIVKSHGKKMSDNYFHFKFYKTLVKLCLVI